MSKNPTHQRKAQETNAPSQPQKPGLDESISELTVKATKGLQQHWKILAIAVVAVLAIICVREIVSALHESSESEQQAKIFSVTGALRDDQDPEVDAMRTVLAEVEGSDSEKGAYKAMVAFLLERADRQKESGNPFQISINGSGADDEETDAEKAKKKAWRTAAGEIAAQGAARFTDDADIQEWAKAVQTRVAGDNDPTWIPPKRSYTLKPPAAKTE